MGIRRGSISTPIIADGLVFNMDPANRASTIPSSATTKAFNTIDTTVSGSFINDTMYDSSTISPSYAFDGTGDYMDCGNNSSTNIAASNLTISFWVKSASDSQSNYTGLISKAPNTNSIVSAGQYEIEISTSQNTRYIVTGVDLKAGSETTGTVPTLTLNTWENITMTWDGNSIIAYKNATVTATKTSPSATAPGSKTHPLRIGKREGFGEFNGNIGPIHIYNRALSANEVLHNYNALKGRFPIPSLLLDTYAGAAAAYSLRRLSNNYTGNAIRVRRSSDNSEQDIGFINNELDTVSLLSFVGSNDGYVTTWYDQGGNEHNITQSTAGKQPLIVSSGTVRTTDSKSSIYFNSTRRDILSGARINELHNGTKCFTVSLVKSNLNTTGRQTIMRTGHVFSSNKGYNLHIKTNPGYVESRVNNGSGTVSLNQTSDDYPVNNRYLITDILDVSNATLADRSTLNINNSSDIKNNTSNGSATTADSNLGIGIGGITSDSFFRGDMQEIIIYTSDQSSNKSGITENINNHYSIY